MPENKRDTFIPNSYQTPNDHADRFMHLLTGDEWKVLSYTTRRIIGFWKRQDRISLTQYRSGCRSSEDGSYLDHGTGLSRPALVRILSFLVAVGLLERAPNDARDNEGDSYLLQLDASKVDVQALDARAEERRRLNVRRTATARSRTPKRRMEKTEAGKSDLPEVVSPTYQQSDAEGGKSDLPEVVSPTYPARYVGLTHNIQEELQKKNSSTHTHVLDSPSRARDPDGGVCVSSEDAPTEDDYYEFARSTKSFHSPDAWAQVHWPLRDADRLIREWKEANKPEAVKARRNQPPDNGMSFHVAVAHIESILSAYPRTNVSELIASLSLSDEVRARIAERFSSRAAEPEAAAGSSRQYRTRAP